MASHISSAEAAKTFADVVERVRSHGEVFVVESDGEPVCRIEPIIPSRSTVRDLVHLLRTIPHPDEDYLNILEGVTRAQPEAEDTLWEQ